jgi:hypothetical protein
MAPNFWHTVYIYIYGDTEDGNIKGYQVEKKLYNTFSLIKCEYSKQCLAVPLENS